MNHLKNELDAIVGDFSKELERLPQGIVKARIEQKKNKRRKIFAFSGVVLLLLSILLIADYIEKQKHQTYRIERPVYYNEDMYAYFKAITHYYTDIGENHDRFAFDSMINFMALEHYVHEQGMKYSEESYNELYENIAQSYLNEDMDEEEFFNDALQYSGISKERYVKKLLAPMEAKKQLYFNSIAEEYSYINYYSILVNFEKKYEQEIKQLAQKFDLQYSKIFNFETYEGTVVAYQAGSMLVVQGATISDIESLTIDEIVDKYGNGTWFTIETYDRLLIVGDEVKVLYEAMDSSLPGQAVTISADVVQRGNFPSVYYDEHLFSYFMLYFSHIDDVETRKKYAFSLYVEWLGQLDYAKSLGFEIDENNLSNYLSESRYDVLGRDGFIDDEVLAEQTYYVGINEEKYRFLVVSSEEALQRSLYRWNIGKAILPYGHSHLSQFKKIHKEKIIKLAKSLEASYDESIDLPYYIGKIVEADGSSIQLIAGKSVDEVVKWTNDDMENKRQQAITLSSFLHPLISKDDVVKIYYDGNQVIRIVNIVDY